MVQDKINKTAVIIPARLNSTRLKNKLLLTVNDKPVIQYVYESAKKAKLTSKVIIATDSEEIYGIAKNFGAEVEMTSADHKSGSDKALDVIQNTNADISTLVRKITDKEQIESPNCVKCVFDNDFNALYFSRYPIPYPRNPEFATYYAHIGMYGYKKDALLKMTSLPQAEIEKTESLEQLRALYNGMKIKVVITNLNPTGIDTIEDFNKFKASISK